MSVRKGTHQKLAGRPWPASPQLLIIDAQGRYPGGPSPAPAGLLLGGAGERLQGLVPLRAGRFVYAALDLGPNPSIPKLEDHHRPHVLKVKAQSTV